MYGYHTFHEKIMGKLIENVRGGFNSHAYIFEGRDGADLKNSAMLFAAALTCLNIKSAPCGACRSCVESKAGTNPDIMHIVREIEDGKQKKTLGIEPIRKAVKDAQIRPFNAPLKVYIIEDGHLMTEDAQNAFLKTLEEPPEYAVFIILAPNCETLLQTILSRAVLIHFPPVSDSVTEKYIRGKYPDEEYRLNFLVKYCGGIPSEADKIIGNEAFEALRAGALEMLPLLLSKNTGDAFKIQKFFTDNKEDTDMLLDFWISYLRDIVIILRGMLDKIINTDKSEELRRISVNTQPHLCVKAVDEIIKTKDMLKRSVKHSAAIMHCALSLK